MTGPIIAIASNLEYLNEDKLTLNIAYAQAIRNTGAIPVILPVTDDHDEISTGLDLASGLLLPGGSDISPRFFRAEPHPDIEEVKPELDRFQLAMTAMALERQLPILGICRGAQVLNVALGGSLIQHIAPGKDTVQHRQKSRRNVPSHSVTAEAGSLVEQILGRTFRVNSYHHQAVDTLGQGLRITARASDGIVEAVELEGHPFVIGVQWHPENMADQDGPMAPLFQVFVEVCASRLPSHSQETEDRQQRSSVRRTIQI